MKTEFRIHPAFPLVFLFPLLGILDLRLTALFWMGAALHECGHLLAAYRRGIGIKTIRLLPFGIEIRTENQLSASPEDEIFIAAAGPAVNLLIALFTAALPLPVSEETAAWLYCHLAQFFINLLPILPLDGGRILYYALARRRDAGTCERVCKGFAWAVLILTLAPALLSAIRQKNASGLLIWSYLLFHTLYFRGSV